MIALVTGGSGGLGSAICRRLARDQHSVVVGCHAHFEVAEDIAGECRAENVQAMALSFDVADPEACADAVDQIVSDFGGLDFLVLAAASNANGLLAELPPATIARMHAVNVAGACHCISAALPHLMASEQGRIVLFSSVLAQATIPGVSVYASTKGAIESLTRTLAVELGPKGITVNALAPGMIDAGLGKPSVEAAGRGIRKLVPLRRPGSASDVAAAVAFLTCEEANYVSGTVLPVDGGFLASARWTTGLSIGETGRGTP